MLIPSSIKKRILVDRLELFPVEQREERAILDLQVHKNGYYVGYISQELGCSPQVSRSST
jgi:hypothetical protein